MEVSNPSPPFTPPHTWNFLMLLSMRPRSACAGDWLDSPGSRAGSTPSSASRSRSRELFMNSATKNRPCPLT